MRAVVLGPDGEPALADVPEPEGPASSSACSPAGSAARMSRSSATRPCSGAVLGHEVVAETAEGRRVALVHHSSCGECDRCRAGHESTCEAFSAPTIRPGGFAEAVRAQAWVDIPAGVDDATATAAEPLACVLRGAERVPSGRVVVVGHGFIGHLFAGVLRRRGDEVFVETRDPRRDGLRPDGPVAAAVLTGGGGVETALDALSPGGTVLVFADADRSRLHASTAGSSR